MLCLNILHKHFAGQINRQNQICMQLYHTAEVRGKIGLIQCSHLWCQNTVGVVLLLLQNPVKKNLRLHRRSLKTKGFPKSQSGSNLLLVEYWLINRSCTNYCMETFMPFNYLNVTTSCLHQFSILFQGSQSVFLVHFLNKENG